VTTIKASCPSCGEVELTSDDIRLRVCSQGQLSYYTFTCPSCVENVRKPADDHIVSLLMSGGVEAEVWDVPAEALEPKAGAELTYDDLLDFLLQLTGDDLLAARAASPAHR
jgi:rRNA maturation protein Nop10